MKAETRSLQQVFHGERRFLVPIYQRPYVWDREQQWEPLWADVEATAERLRESRVVGQAKGLDPAFADQGTSPHFLGAVVVELQPAVVGDVDARLVVDGQQRLTTLQLMLRGTLDALEETGADGPVQARIRKAILNDAEVVPATELLKVSPRLADRQAFAAAMEADRPDPSINVFAAARHFFAESAKDYLTDPDEASLGFAGNLATPAARGALLAAALLGLLKLVVIELEDNDDAQVIFEALNARGMPLSATDLVKNALFLQAHRENQDPALLYEKLWRRFDDDGEWWLQGVGIGHAQRARQDWLLGDWLIASTTKAINVGRLYAELQRWLQASGLKANDALLSLNRFADAYEALHGRRKGATAIERRAYERLELLNITVATPVLLWLLTRPADVLDSTKRERAIAAIESYVIRRMAAKYQTRAYGQVFVEVLKAAATAEPDPAAP